MRQPWTKLYDGLEFEIKQAKDEGRTINTQTIAIINKALELPEGPEKTSAAVSAFNHIQSLDYLNGVRHEPDDLQSIQTLATGNSQMQADHDKLLDKVYGGWLGRCAGCLLGKPVEGWSVASITALLKSTDNYPIHNYMRSDVSEDIIRKVNESQKPGMYDSFAPHRAFIDQVNCMPADDDLNYTIIGLKILESYGLDFTSSDVATCWLSSLPYYHLCTAERIAYRNLVMNIEASQSANYCNAYREWIGAQIRADIFGYINPGNPRKAAEMAWRDASISHVKNGIYGEMWVAAMLATAYTTTSIEAVIRAGMAEIPAHCRLVAALNEIFDWFKKGICWEEAVNRLHMLWNENSEHHWTHTITNAQIVTLSLLYGEKNLERTIGIAVMAGFDTDCNGATAGSVLGIMLGARALPQKWIDPLNNTLESGVHGFDRVRIDDMAKRSLALIVKRESYMSTSKNSIKNA